MKCRKCQGSLDRVGRIPDQVLYCRPCRLPHTGDGVPMLEGPDLLRSSLDVLKTARERVQAPPDSDPLLRHAMEISFIQGLQEAYIAGLKDGVLLARSADNL